MTIKEEIIHVLERIAKTIPSRTVSVILLCEGNAEQPSIFGIAKNDSKITIMSAETSPDTIAELLLHAYNMAQKPSKNK